MAGVLVASFASRFLAHYENLFRLPLRLQSGLDGRILAFSLALSCLTALLFGAAPMYQTVRAAILPALKADAKRSGTRVFGARNALVVFQVAVSMVLLVAASLLVRTLRNAQSTDLTQNPERILLLELNLSQRKHTGVEKIAFYNNLLDKLRRLPGVERAALVARVPMGGGGNSIDIVSAERGQVGVDFNVASEEYFETVGLPLIRGRLLSREDREGAPRVAVINEVMARWMWPNQDPIGKRFAVREVPAKVEVVGVIRDGRFRDYRDSLRPRFYFPLAQVYGKEPDSFFRWVTDRMRLEVRAFASPTALAGGVRREIHALDRNLRVGQLQTLAAYRDAGLGRERLSALLLSCFGVLAALVTAIGLYGVLAFTVALRKREIGIRMAVGAAPRQVMWNVLLHALTLVAAGIAAGSVTAFALARTVSSFLFGGLGVGCCDVRGCRDHSRWNQRYGCVSACAASGTD